MVKIRVRIEKYWFVAVVVRPLSGLGRFQKRVRLPPGLAQKAWRWIMLKEDTGTSCPTDDWMTKRRADRSKII
jgi:hypothetical protein